MWQKLPGFYWQKFIFKYTFRRCVIGGRRMWGVKLVTWCIVVYTIIENKAKNFIWMKTLASNEKFDADFVRVIMILQNYNSKIPRQQKYTSKICLLKKSKKSRSLMCVFQNCTKITISREKIYLLKYFKNFNLILNLSPKLCSASSTKVWGIIAIALWHGAWNLKITGFLKIYDGN